MAAVGQQDQRVVIGMDPHKRSVTIEVTTGDETILAGGRYATDEAGFAAMRRDVAGFGDRVWAIEGCRGIGRHVAGTNQDFLLMFKRDDIWLWESTL